MAANAGYATLYSPFIVSMYEVILMTQVERIQTEILTLPYEEFASLRKRFAQLEWERWDQQIEEDAVIGKLDFLLDEAKVAKKKVAL
ncbi:MAG: hypothetical protein R2911_10670 [Caldilineaceae bacterium]